MRACLKKVFFGLLFVTYPAIAIDLSQADFPVEIVLQNASLRISDSVSLRRVCVSFSEYFNNSNFGDGYIGQKRATKLKVRIPLRNAVNER